MSRNIYTAGDDRLSRTEPRVVADALAHEWFHGDIRWRVILTSRVGVPESCRANTAP